MHVKFTPSQTKKLILDKLKQNGFKIKLSDLKISQDGGCVVKIGEVSPTLAEKEQEHIEHVLNICNGNVSMTAEVLQISRRTLQRKMKQYKKVK